MRQLILIMIVLCVPLALADKEVNLSFTLDDLPVTNTTSFNFSLRPNSSIFFGLVQDNPKVNLSFPETITLGENESSKTFSVNYTIPFFVDYDKNVTEITEIIGVTNSVNSNLVLIILNFLVNHTYLNKTEEPPPQAFLDVSDDGKQVQIQTYTVIEFDKNHTVELYAPNGSVVDVDCGKFISCPNNVTPNEQNYTSFKGHIFIPMETQEGDYDSYIRMSLENRTSEILFEISVSYRDDIYKVISYEVWDSSCYESPEDLARCYKEQARYNADVANQLIERLREKNETCEPEIINNTVKKYVEVGDIDPEILKENRELRDDNKELRANLDKANKKLDSCLDDKGELQSEVKSVSNEFLLKKDRLNQETLTEKAEVKASMKDTLSTILFYLFIIFLIAYIVGIIAEANWVISYFPRLVFLLIVLFFLMAWGITKLIG